MLRHIRSQPFIAATGIAALVHSTWSLATLFSGEEPVQFSVAWFGWLIPDMLIAFALDIGQIATSAEIRAGHRSRAKYAAFGTFASATYYLQWLYISHHIPLLNFGPGVAPEWSAAATVTRNLAVWVLPGLLPLSTLLYTFSHDEGGEAAAQVVTTQEERSATMQAAELVALPENAQAALPVATDPIRSLADGRFAITCVVCGWSATKADERSARNALAGHLSRCRSRSNGTSALALPGFEDRTPGEASQEPSDQ